MVENKGAIIIVGGQYGDEGKGLFSGYLSARDGAAAIYRAGVGPNAEHGIIREGKYIKCNQLPGGLFLSPESQIRIGSGVAVNPQLLIEEMDKFDLHGQVKVDFRCPIVTEEHIRIEKESAGMKGIGSTFSGSGQCRSEFALRTVQQARDIPSLKSYLFDSGVEINKMATDEVVTIEASQGTYLSLAVSPYYPNVTSDNTTAMAAADDVLLNWRKINEVVVAIKAVPSREGAGPMGSTELTEEEIHAQGIAEYSSIGGALRRKGTEINWEMLAYTAEINGATQVALSFCEHYDPKVDNITKRDDITNRLWELIEKVENTTGAPVTLLNTGKEYSSIVDLTGGSVDWKEIDSKLKKMYERAYP